MSMTREQVFEELSVIIAEITGFEPEEISRDGSLIEDIGIESFDMVDITFRVEEVFGIQIGKKSFWNFGDIFENPDLIDENNLLTLKGIQEMKSRVPDLDSDNTIENQGQISFMDMFAAIKVYHFVEFIYLNQTT